MGTDNRKNRKWRGARRASAGRLGKSGSCETISYRAPSTDWKSGRSQGRCTRTIEWSEVDGCWGRGKHVLHNPVINVHTMGDSRGRPTYMTACRNKVTRPIENNTASHDFDGFEHGYYTKDGIANHVVPSSLFKPSQIPALIQSQVHVGIWPYVLPKVVE